MVNTNNGTVPIRMCNLCDDTVMVPKYSILEILSEVDEIFPVSLDTPKVSQASHILKDPVIIRDLPKTDELPEIPKHVK